MSHSVKCLLWGGLAAGYVRVRNTLQSESHPAVFAAGDAASLQPPLPKSGVYAVRAGQALDWGVEDAIRNMRVIDALFTSEKSGAWVSV